MVQKIQMSNQVLIEDDSSVGVQEAASQSPLVGSRSPISSLRRPLSNSIPIPKSPRASGRRVRTRARRGRQSNAPNSPSRWVPQHFGGSPRRTPPAAAAESMEPFACGVHSGRTARRSSLGASPARRSAPPPRGAARTGMPPSNATRLLAASSLFGGLPAQRAAPMPP